MSNPKTSLSTDVHEKPIFTQVTDTVVISKIFNATLKHHIPVTLWSKKQEVKFNAKLVEYFPETKSLIFEFSESIRFSTPIEKLPRLFATMLIDRANFFFETLCTRKIGIKRIAIKCPELVYKMLRRAGLRIPLPRSMAPILCIVDSSVDNFDQNQTYSESQLKKFRVLDIGVGGLAFACTLEEKDLFKKGQIIPLAFFRLKDYEIKTVIQIRYVTESKSDRHKKIIRVGIKFLQLKHQDESFLGKLIADESRNQFVMIK